MDLFRVKSGDRILLLGEGNFSFCKGFLKLNSDIFTKSESLPPSTEIIATCFEPNENLSEIKEHNVIFLKERDVTVLFSIDATHLKDYPTITNAKFTKIIFNFPHIGGKMKIHLNRKLLADFFSSSKEVLDENGSILLTLCDGQGGTDADKNRRRWDDSWKVVEMAGQADFALKNVHSFPHKDFPDYINSGYRSMEKGFNANSALTHVFKISKPPLFAVVNDFEIQSLFQAEEISTSFGTEMVSKVHLKKILCNPFNDKLSLQAYLYTFINNMQFTNNITFYEDYNLIYGFSCQYSTAYSLINEHLIFRKNYSKCMEVFQGLNLHKLSSNFLQPPVTCDIVCVGNESCRFSKQVVLELLTLFGCTENVTSKLIKVGELFYLVSNCKTFDVLSVSSLVSSDNHSIEVCIIHLDPFAMFLLHLNSWHEIWAKGNKVEINEGKIKLLTPCLFPCTYVFDLSLSTRGNYIEEDFYNILWYTAGDFVFDVSLISTYQPANSDAKNFCYRISYRSYDVPFYKKRVVDIQNNIGRTLEKLLNVTVL